MKIAIFRKGDTITTIKDYLDIGDKGEVAHMICELESIKLDLLEIWEEMDKKDSLGEDLD